MSYTVFAANAIVTIMVATGCPKIVAVEELKAASENYVGQEMSTEDLTEMLLSAITLVQARQELGT